MLFRAGQVDGTQWDDANIGLYSASIGGLNNLASGTGSFTGGGVANIISDSYSFIGGGIGHNISETSSFIGGGSNNTISGGDSFIGGGSSSNTASGQRIFIGGGAGLLARSYVEAVFGYYNTDYTPGSTSSFDPTDRLFVIGNGTSTSNRSNAVTVMKNGNVGIGTAAPNTLLSITPSNIGSKLTLWDGGSSTDHYGLGISALQMNYHVAATSADHVFYASGKNGAGSGIVELMRVKGNGNVGIGTITPQSKLSVNGTITCKEVEVTLVGFPDYVFEDDYNLMPLKDIETHILKHGHLPNVPSAKEVEENGLGLGEMNKILLEKVEELTLHIIEQEKKIEALMGKK